MRSSMTSRFADENPLEDAIEISHTVDNRSLSSPASRMLDWWRSDTTRSQMGHCILFSAEANSRGTSSFSCGVESFL